MTTVLTVRFNASQMGSNRAKLQAPYSMHTVNAIMNFLRKLPPELISTGVIQLSPGLQRSTGISTIVIKDNLGMKALRALLSQALGVQDQNPLPRSLENFSIQTSGQEDDLTISISLETKRVDQTPLLDTPSAFSQPFMSTSVKTSGPEASRPVPVVSEKPAEPTSPTPSIPVAVVALPKEQPAIVTLPPTPAAPPQEAIPQPSPTTPTPPLPKPFQLSKTQKILQWASISVALAGGVSSLVCGLFLTVSPIIIGSLIIPTLISIVTLVTNSILIKQARDNHNGVGIISISGINLTAEQREILRQQLIAHNLGRGVRIIRDYADKYWSFIVIPKTDKAITRLLEQLIGPKASEQNLIIAHDVKYSLNNGWRNVDYYLHPPGRSWEKQHLLTLRGTF
jgi:hypothetical protein